MKIINPNDLKPEDKPILLALFQQANNERSGWGSDRYYVVDPGSGSIKVSLTHTVIKAESKKGGYGYHVLGTRSMGEGNYGVVYPVTTTYKIKGELNNKLINKKKEPGKRRIAKRQQFSGAKKTVDAILNEYQLMKKTPHLSPKYPVSYGNAIYTISRRLEGQELFKIIENDRSNLKILTLEQRFKLTINLLIALQEQVVDVGLVHQDIKPENIIADENCASAGTIDFGLAKIAGSPRADSGCSLPYASPEVFKDEETNNFSDVYSMGRTLALLWGISGKGYNSKTAEDAIDVALANDYSTLFTYPDKAMSQLNPQAAELIKKTLRRMTAFEIKDRLSLQDALHNFQIASDLHFMPGVTTKLSNMSLSSSSSSSSSSSVNIKKIEELQESKQLTFSPLKQPGKYGNLAIKKELVEKRKKRNNIVQGMFFYKPDESDKKRTSTSMEQEKKLSSTEKPDGAS